MGGLWSPQAPLVIDGPGSGSSLGVVLDPARGASSGNSAHPGVGGMGGPFEAPISINKTSYQPTRTDATSDVRQPGRYARSRLYLIRCGLSASAPMRRRRSASYAA